MKKSRFKVWNIFFVLILLIATCISIRYSKLKESRVIDGSIENLDNEIETQDNKNVNINSKFYRVMSRYSVDNNITYSELFNSEESLTRLKSMNKELKEKFDYIEFEFQSLYYLGYYDKEQKFTNSFGTSSDTTNQEINDKNGAKIYVTDLKTMQLGEKCYKIFEDRIYLGNNFNLSDFKINDSNSTVNIILGNEYLNYYKLGDIINLSLHQKNINFKVIGFYKKETCINYQGSIVTLDQCIIMPYYEIEYDPTDEEDALYQKIYYSQKNNGHIRILENNEVNNPDIYKNYLKNVEELSKKYDLVYSIPFLPVTIDLNPEMASER